MFGNTQSILGSDIKVLATEGRGWTPEEIADRAIDKIIYVGKDAHPLLKDQAEAYKAHIRSVIVFYLNQAVQSDRTTLANRLTEAGYPELTSILEN